MSHYLKSNGRKTEETGEKHTNNYYSLKSRLKELRLKFPSVATDENLSMLFKISERDVRLLLQD